jgi:hypothetical protein
MGGKPTKLVCAQAKAAVLSALDCARYAVTFDCIRGNLPKACQAANLNMQRIDNLLKCPEAPAFFQSQTAQVLKSIGQLAAFFIERGHLFDAVTRQEVNKYLAYAEGVVSAWNAEAGEELNQRQIDDLWTVAQGLQVAAGQRQPVPAEALGAGPLAPGASATAFGEDRTRYFV